MAELEYKVRCKIGKVFITNRLGYKKLVGYGVEALKEVIAVLSEGRTEPLDIDSHLQHWEEKLSRFETMHTFDIGIVVDNQTFFSLDYELEDAAMLRKYLENIPVPDVVLQGALKETPKEPVPEYRPKLHAYAKRRNYAKKNIAKESGQNDLQAIYTKGEGWRLTGLYPDGKRMSVGGLGVVPNDKEFYKKLEAFWLGVTSIKRLMTGDAEYSYLVENK